MKKIYKYILKIHGKQILELPAYCDILKAGDQNGNLCVWCLVDTSQTQVQRKEITIIGTGEDINHEHIYKGNHFDTVVMGNGLVWHIFIN